MREILFRGKCVDTREKTGEWVYGGYVKIDPCCGGDTCIAVPTREGVCGGLNMEYWPLDLVEVDPATVGQYTGLTDRNGTKIFEGDIVDWKGRTKKYEVFFDESEAMFSIRGEHGSEFVLGLCDYENIHTVLGNIHDAKEEA